MIKAPSTHFGRKEQSRGSPLDSCVTLSYTTMASLTDLRGAAFDYVIIGGKAASRLSSCALPVL